MFPCYIPVFILKLSECKQAELSTDFFADFVYVLVAINDTVQLYIHLNFIFIITTSSNSLSLINKIHSPSHEFLKMYQQVKWS